MSDEHLGTTDFIGIGQEMKNLIEWTKQHAKFQPNGMIEGNGYNSLAPLVAKLEAKVFYT